jgi:hypothetical protein
VEFHFYDSGSLFITLYPLATTLDPSTDLFPHETWCLHCACFQFQQFHRHIFLDVYLLIRVGIRSFAAGWDAVEFLVLTFSLLIFCFASSFSDNRFPNSLAFLRNSYEEIHHNRQAHVIGPLTAVPASLGCRTEFSWAPSSLTSVRSRKATDDVHILSVIVMTKFYGQ